LTNDDSLLPMNDTNEEQRLSEVGGRPAGQKWLTFHYFAQRAHLSISRPFFFFPLQGCLSLFL